MAGFVLTFGADRSIEVFDGGLTAFLRDMERRLAAGLGFSVATLNLDHVEKLGWSDSFHRAYAAHSHVVADGNPIVWASRLAGRPATLMPGSDMIHPLAAIAAREGAPVALMGATDETLRLAAERLQARHPGLRIVARHAPKMGFDAEGPEGDAALEILRASGARLVFLALGAPRQEAFAARAQGVLPQTGFVSIGAGLDFIAGAQRRAPRWMRDWALEWLWRAATDPKRLAKRYLRGGLVFPGLALKALRLRRADAKAAEAAAARQGSTEDKSLQEA
ncbi:MAG: WecB/TagA/CpsF family glycosyltransferase [Pseudomonadota bacterium]